MKDRVPRYPGRVTLTPVTGQANTYDMTRADEPTEAGTPLNTASLLTAATAQAIFGDSNDHTVNEALLKLNNTARNFVYVEFEESVTWTAPNNIVDNKITVLCCGGGGGGGSSYYSGDTVTVIGGGGGSGYITKQKIAVTPGQSYNIVIGAGGATKISSDGGRGGSTIFGANLVVAEGGYGGTTGTYSNSRAVGGNGGNGNAGGGGGYAYIEGYGNAYGGNGGNGGTYGGGGGGGYSSGATNEYGGNGGNGGTYGGGGGGGYSSDTKGTGGSGGTYGGAGGSYGVTAESGTPFSDFNPAPYIPNYSGKAGTDRNAGGGGYGGNGGKGSVNANYAGAGGGGYGGNGGGIYQYSRNGGGGGGYGGNGGDTDEGYTPRYAGGGGGYFGKGGGGHVISGTNTDLRPYRGGGGGSGQTGASGVCAIWYYTT